MDALRGMQKLLAFWSSQFRGEGAYNEVIFSLNLKSKYAGRSLRKTWKKSLISEISGKCLFFLENYLSNRYQNTEVNGILSKMSFSEDEVPQGSVFGAFFFLIYITDISDHLDSFITMNFAGATAQLSDPQQTTTRKSMKL